MKDKSDIGGGWLWGWGFGYVGGAGGGAIALHTDGGPKTVFAAMFLRARMTSPSDGSPNKSLPPCSLGPE